MTIENAQKVAEDLDRQHLDRINFYASLDAASIPADNSWNEGIVLGRAMLLEDDVILIGRKGILEQNGTVVGGGCTLANGS